MTALGPIRVIAMLAVLSAVGCGGVSRRFVVESNVPNAQVYIDERPVGPAPAHMNFEYYGHYTIKLVQPGYETSIKRVHVVAPWYAYPPFDFLTGFWPFGIEDVRRYYFELCPAQQTRTDQLLTNATALRERGWALPPPEHPAQPGDGTLGPPLPAGTAPGPGSQPLPPPSPVPGGAVPGPSPVVPSVVPSGGSITPPATFLR